MSLGRRAMLHEKSARRTHYECLAWKTGVSIKDRPRETLVRLRICTGANKQRIEG